MSILSIGSKSFVIFAETPEVIILHVLKKAKANIMLKSLETEISQNCAKYGEYMPGVKIHTLMFREIHYFINIKITENEHIDTTMMTTGVLIPSATKRPQAVASTQCL